MTVESLLVGVAAFFAALWWGERGRRRDAQIREGAIHVPRAVPRASVRVPELPGEVDVAQDLAEAPSRFVEETMAETGCTRAEAELEWKRLVVQAAGDGGGPGWP